MDPGLEGEIEGVDTIGGEEQNAREILQCSEEDCDLCQ
jgi:hypothetical protein